MKSPGLVIIGIILLAVGGYALIEGGYFASKREVLDIGGLSVSTEEKTAIQPWMAGIALVAGAGILIAGLTRKT